MTEHRRPRGPRRAPRIAVAWGISVFLLLTGATAANAAWTTATTTITPAASGGTVDATFGGSAPGPITWTSASHSTTVPVALNNTGLLDADWSYTLSSSSAAASATTFTSWVLSPGEQCTSASTPHDQVTSTASAPVALTGHFASGASVDVCTRAAITDAGQVTYGGQSLVVTVALQDSVGSWTGGQSFDISVAIADDHAPSIPTVTLDRISGYSTRVNWIPSTDNVGVTGYRIYRNGTQVAQVDGNATQWTDATLANSTTYTWAVEAFDAAGNVARSPGVQARTLSIVSNAKYAIYYPNGNRCVDASGAGRDIGTNIIIWDCSYAANQLWTMRPTGDGSYQLESVNSTNTAIGSSSRNLSQQLQLSGKSTPSTRWSFTADGNGYRLTNDSNQMCMDVYGMGTANNTAVTQYTCLGNAAQFFQLQKR